MKSSFLGGLIGLVVAMAPLASAQVYSVSTLAGAPGAAGAVDAVGAEARFSSPVGVAVDGAGNVYVAATSNAALRKITAGGSVSTVVALPGGVAAVAVDASGNAYLADAASHVIRRVTSGGTVSVFAGLSGSPGSANGTGGSARFNGPAGIAVDAAGNVFVSDTTNNIIRKITSEGVVTTLAGLAGVSGNVDGPGPLARFYQPYGIAVSAAGSVYIADSQNRTIRAISPAGDVTTLAGSPNSYSGYPDGTGSAAGFSSMRGLTIDAAGNLFVADTGANTLRRITPAGVVTTVAGLANTNGSTDSVGNTARFYSPQGIAVDAAGNLYVADTGNQTIRKATLTPLPTIGAQPADTTKVAGQNASFSVTAAGAGTLSYQWQRQAGGTIGFVALTSAGTYSGATSATLAVTAVTEAMNGDQFRCVVTNVGGSLNSSVVSLNVTAAPAITSANAVTFFVGQAGAFAFTASGLPAPTFSVTAGDLPVWATLNATSGALTGTPTSTSGSPFAFTVSATNASGTASQAFTLTVQAAPTAPVVTSPATARQVVASGQPLTLTVSATGTGPLSYQWKRNGQPIAGASAASYTIVSAAARDGGWYTAVVTGPGGTTTSAAVFVVVAYPTTQVVAWGNSATVPDNVTTAVAISAGNAHNLLVKADGTVVGWGSNDYGQTTIPTDLSGVVAVAAGGYHSLALKADGTVVAWGNNNSSQTVVPAGLSRVVAIAAGNYHNLALKQDGTVVAWGSSGSTQINVPAGLSGVVAISAGTENSMALKADGTVVAWGYNGGYAPPSSLSGVVAISAGNYGGIAAKNDGTVVVWGSQSYGQGNVPAGLSLVTSVALTYSNAVALKSDGTMVVWGDTSGAAAVPTSLRSVLAISAGSAQRLALRDASNDLAPTIATSPVNAAANLGQAVTFSAAATAGTAMINYQWYKDTVAISGATAASYTVGEVTAASAGSYYVLASNSLGSAASAVATLTVNASPQVSATTSGRYPLLVGQSLTLNLASTISPSATVQWRRNGVAIAGATGRSHTIASATLGKGGYYQAVFDEGSGPVISGAIFVPVVPAATQVLAWGYSSYETSVPGGLSNVVGLAARGSTILAVKADGSVVRWGGYYSYTAPAGISNIVAVAVGSSHFLALRADGTVLTWGDSSYNPPAAVPSGLTNVVAIAAGSSHSLALKGDGTVVAWGTANYGATAVPAGLAGVVAIAAGDSFSLALRADGTVVGWGYNNNGQAAVPVGLSGVAALAAGTNFSLALKSDGTVVGWGYNGSGQITVPASLTDVVAVAAADSHALAVRADGSVTGWGYNSYGQTTIPAGLRNVQYVAAGSQYSVVVRDASADTAPLLASQPTGGTAFVGQKFVLQVNAGAGTAPVNYQWRKTGVAIAGATTATLSVPVNSSDQAGSYDVVVSNYLGMIISQPAVLTVNTATAVTTSPTGRRLLTAGQSLTLNGATSLGGTVTYQWRRNGRPIAGATTASYVIANATWASGGVYQLIATNGVGPAASAPLYVAVSAGAQLRAWGDSGSGQTSIPAGVTDPVAIAAGSNHSLALKGDGTVVAWGGNSNGQCNIPAGLTNVVAIAAGSSFSMALTAGGTVVTWGSVNYTPPELTSAIAIATDPSSGVATALRTDGTVLSWDSSSVRTDVPAGLTDVIAIASGYYYRLALKADGTVVQWGSSYYSTSYPVPAGLSGVVAVAAGSEHMLALKSDGTVVAWGTSTPTGPTLVPSGLTGVVAIAAGSGTSYAVKSDGSVVTWGNSYYSTTLMTGAVALAPVFALGIGSSHALALRDPSGDVAPAITVQPVAQTATSGQSITLSVTVTGTPAPTYQWYRNGLAISGATSATYTWSPYYYNSTETANYSVTVSNALGSVTSDEVAITILAGAGARGLLTSTARAEAGNSLSGTFTIEGSTKQMLIRAVGPALGAFGITGTVVDPQLIITAANGSVVATNDDWGNATNASQFSYVAYGSGAFALPAGSKDAVVLQNFSPGTYQVRVVSAGNAPGVAMLEIYDADSSSRVVAVSTSALAGTGGQVFVQGLLLANPTAGRSYLVRAIGPSLGTAAALADPKLAVFNSTGVQVATNDNWGGDSALATAAAAVGAMPLATGSKDAVVNFVPASGGAYTVQVSDVSGASGRVLLEIFEVDAQRAATATPSISAQPMATAVLAGSPATLGVVAVGLPAPTYQWRKNNVAITGATSALFSLASAQPGDAGDYSVVVTNTTGAVTSGAATLSVITQAASHLVVGPGYRAGGTVTVSNTLTYTGAASALGWQVTLPAGWSYASGSGAEGDVKPVVGTTGTIEWAWTTPPASPVAFSYTLNVPAGETGVKTLTATVLVQAAGSSATSTVAPAALVVAAAPTLHSADTNKDGTLNLQELLRVIELYNTRHGTTRTGRYAVQSGSEDGFAIDALTADTATVTLGAYHSGDTNHDGKLGLSELLRVIELYNYRNGSTRTGQYHVQTTSEDGFATGP